MYPAPEPGKVEKKKKKGKSKNSAVSGASKETVPSTEMPDIGKLET